MCAHLPAFTWGPCGGPVATNAGEALAHLTDAVTALHGLVQESVRLLQTDYFAAGAAALARPNPSGSAMAAAVGSLDDLRAFQAAASTLPP